MTGRVRYRVEGGKLIVQVEEGPQYRMGYLEGSRWRDATVEDLTTHSLFTQLGQFVDRMEPE